MAAWYQFRYWELAFTIRLEWRIKLDERVTIETAIQGKRNELLEPLCFK